MLPLISFCHWLKRQLDGGLHDSWQDRDEHKRTQGVKKGEARSRGGVKIRRVGPQFSSINKKNESTNKYSEEEATSQASMANEKRQKTRAKESTPRAKRENVLININHFLA